MIFHQLAPFAIVNITKLAKLPFYKMLPLSFLLSLLPTVLVFYMWVCDGFLINVMCVKRFGHIGELIKTTSSSTWQKRLSHTI